MSKPKTGVRVTLSSGVKVEIIELNLGEFENVIALAAKRAGGVDGRIPFATTTEGLRCSIRKVGESKTTYESFTGELLGEQFSVSEIFELGKVWNELHTSKKGENDLGKEEVFTLLA